MIDEYILSTVFHHIPATDDHDEVYWRECVLQDDMIHGDQGYMLYWPADGGYLHTYRYPPNIFES